MIRGLATFLLFIAVSELTSFVIKAIAVMGGENTMLTGVPDRLIHLMCYIATLFIFNSFTSALSVYNTAERVAFLENLRTPYFSDELRAILKDPIFWAETLVTLSLSALASVLGAFSEVCGVIFDNTNIHSAWLPLVITLPLFFLITVFQKYEAMRYWHKLWREGNLEKLDTARRFAARIAVICVLYPTVFPLSPILVYIAISFISTIISVTNAFTVVGVVLAVAVLLLLIFGIALLRAVLKRKKLYKRLFAIVKSEGCEISEITNPYASILSPKKKTYFNITQDNKTYNCTIVSTFFKRVPIVFSSATNAYFRHRIGPKNHHISIDHVVDIFITGDGTHVLILDPLPKHVLVTDGRVEKRVTGGDKLWNFVFYDGTSFLNALDRHCIGRTNSDRF